MNQYFNLTHVRFLPLKRGESNFILRQILILAVFVSALPVFSVEPTREILNLAVNYQAYPYPEQTLPLLTPAPDGYTPFHIEHYGRHGSRWHMGANMYNRPVEYLEKAKKYDKLPLPVSPFEGSYYRWKDLREYYVDKLDRYELFESVVQITHQN